jgi:hypothetical protein
LFCWMQDSKWKSDLIGTGAIVRLCLDLSIGVSALRHNNSRREPAHRVALAIAPGTAAVRVDTRTDVIQLNPPKPLTDAPHAFLLIPSVRNSDLGHGW